ncbi:MAG: carboxypeptidase-like regulatory domain-containing protein [Acidiferrobacterales bacterium]
MKKMIAMGLSSSSFLAGCASILNQGKQEVALLSHPDQAEVVVKDENDSVVFEGTTPTTVKLKRGKGYFKPGRYTVEISKKGYQTQTITLTGDVSGWYVGGNLLFGVFGWVITDPLTGAMWTLKPKEINAELSD